MGRRLQLQADLEALIGSPNVYYQPPDNTQMVYPCIVYRRYTGLTKSADNIPYSFTLRYEVMVIDRDPDSEIPAKMAALPQCVLIRTFVVDNLHHDVYYLYY